MYVFLWSFSALLLPYWNSSFYKSRHHELITSPSTRFWEVTDPTPDGEYKVFVETAKAA